MKPDQSLGDYELKQAAIVPNLLEDPLLPDRLSKVCIKQLWLNGGRRMGCKARKNAQGRSED